MTDWITLGGVPPADLVRARLELHHAAQLLSAFGQTLLAPRADDSHRSMAWRGSAFVSGRTEDEAALRASLTPAGLTLALLSGGDTLGARSLVGLTPDEAHAWLEAELHSALERPELVLGLPEYDLPPRLAQGPFEGSPGALAELAAWYADAAGQLETLVSAEPRATPVRCWPHHFDIATLVVLDPEIGPGEGRSVGVGLSPGDGGIAEPYWYVTPYPYPEDPELPDLPGGYWNTEGWFGAVLPGSAVTGAGAAEEQQRLTADFVSTAVSAGKDLLGA